MAIGERIRYFRNRKNMTQKYLGQELGFSEKAADVRIAQYELGSRTPKADLVEALSIVFDVDPKALSVPDIDSIAGLAHTFFALEDLYGLKVGEVDGEVCLRIGKNAKGERSQVLDFLEYWNKAAKRYEQGEITKEYYDYWRYHFPNAMTEEALQEESEEMCKENGLDVDAMHFRDYLTRELVKEMQKKTLEEYKKRAD